MATKVRNRPYADHEPVALIHALSGCIARVTNEINGRGLKGTTAKEESRLIAEVLTRLLGRDPTDDEIYMAKSD